MPARSPTLHPLMAVLQPLAQRRRQLRVDLFVTGCWFTLFFVGWAGVRLGWLNATPSFGVIVLVSGAVVAGCARWYRTVPDADLSGLARSIERKNPHLHGQLVTAVEQKPEESSGQFNFLQRRLLLQTLEDWRRKPWVEASAGWSREAVTLGYWLSLFALLVLVSHSLDYARTHAVPAGSTTAAEVEVTPGDVTLERGSTLIVTAKFSADLPGEAALLLKPPAGEPQRIVLQKSLNDPVFGGALPEVKTDLAYTIAYHGRETRAYQIHVFDFPRLERADVHLHYPAYTKLPEKTIADTKRVSAVEGTKVDLQLQLNKPVQSAALVSKAGETIPLNIAAGEAKAELHGYQPTKSQSFELRLIDSEGRASKVPATLAMEVLPNRPPDIKILTPKGDQRVSPLQEVTFQAEVWDDFGLPTYGLTYTVAGGETKELALGHDAPGEQKLRAEHVLKLEELGVQPDQLISWYAWAEDVGPDGRSRRVASDLYLAEVRPFEEIFRPGDAAEAQKQQQAGGGAGAETEKLGELQKQVITATWKLQRTEGAQADHAIDPGEQYGQDVAVVLKAQTHARELTQALREKLEEPLVQGMAELAMSEMQKAAGQLEKASASTAPLPAAQSAEQSAYNALLKLAAHEFRVSRSRSQQQGQESQSRQQQLDKLEMKEEKDRYETQKEAAPQQKEEAREQLTILNRLKELAQRQHDINDKVKELQAALQEAKTEQRQEKVKKELKRLQEEQQQMLAEVDDLQQKMQNQPDPTRYAEERKQLEQSREEAQKTNEALREEKPGEALAAGTRTERDLQKLRDDFRQKSSAQFNEQMRQMRSEARTLAADQQELTEKLGQEAKGTKPTERPTLDGVSPRDQLAARADQQQERLKSLQGEMKNVSEQAESAEPLLAKELYDTLRKTAQADTEETLRKTSLLVKRGYSAQARQLNERAGQEIVELKTGVERAAESVLGNEADALRLARSELDALARQLNQEIAAAAPQLAPAEEKTPSTSPTSQPQDSTSSATSDGPQEKLPPQVASSAGPKAGETGAAPASAQPSGEEGSKPSANGQGQQGMKGRKGPRSSDGKGGEVGTPPDGAKEPPTDQRLAQERGQQNSGEQKGASPQSGQNEKAPGEGHGQGSQPGKGQGEAPGSPGLKAQSPAGAKGAGSADTGNSPQNESGQPGGNLRQAANRSPGRRTGGEEGGDTRGGGLEQQEGPIRGANFTQWSDRLRNVEEMVDNADLRAEVARIRQTAQAARAEYKRHSEEPKWDLIQAQVSKPLAQMRDRVAEELARRESKESLVPIDRDPVPPKYAEQVQRYYEVLGAGESEPAAKR